MKGAHSAYPRTTYGLVVKTFFRVWERRVRIPSHGRGNWTWVTHILHHCHHIKKNKKETKLTTKESCTEPNLLNIPLEHLSDQD